MGGVVLPAALVVAVAQILVLALLVSVLVEFVVALAVVLWGKHALSFIVLLQALTVSFSVMLVVA